MRSNKDSILSLPERHGSESFVANIFNWFSMKYRAGFKLG
jgi:hypothetical protein